MFTYIVLVKLHANQQELLFPSENILIIKLIHIRVENELLLGNSRLRKVITYSRPHVLDVESKPLRASRVVHLRSAMSREALTLD